jgi:hypothetical protein
MRKKWLPFVLLLILERISELEAELNDRGFLQGI